ncbi:UNVERIFIED_CONTAM: hypothetical protein GTU68_057810 [Idotea baltica]|nr:hypothetical protein [Idotea baltica]
MPEATPSISRPETASSGPNPEVPFLFRIHPPDNKDTSLLPSPTVRNTT